MKRFRDRVLTYCVYAPDHDPIKGTGPGIIWEFRTKARARRKAFALGFGSWINQYLDFDYTEKDSVSGLFSNHAWRVTEVRGFKKLTRILNEVRP